MTIGFAATLVVDGRCSFIMVADSRASAEDQKSDLALKTYSLDQRVGAVGAGNAVSCITAIEITRDIVADHNRLQPDKPINFYSTVRLFAYFLDKADGDRAWSAGSEVVLVGFLSNGNPAMAKIITRPGEKTEAYLVAQTQPGALVMMVGKSDAKAQIAAALNESFAAPGLGWADRAAGTIWYLCQHDGEPNIGGGLSVGVCPADEVMYWPVVGVGDRTFLRGIEMTGVVAPTARSLTLTYDESWHAGVDQERQVVPQKMDVGFVGVAHHVERWVLPAELFDWKIDPTALSTALNPGLPAATVLVGRPGEIVGYG
jgi:hypothetical protein